MEKITPPQPCLYYNCPSSKRLRIRRWFGSAAETGLRASLSRATSQILGNPNSYAVLWGSRLYGGCFRIEIQQLLSCRDILRQIAMLSA